ncbi:MAG: alpha/beta fold hydrolase [Bacteroidia bacterium]|nr:alpha/beta fold hydrolase [Bacteroidia bacterium]
MNRLIAVILLTLFTVISWTYNVSAKSPDRKAAYEVFCKAQKSFESPDGTIRYIDSGQSERVMVLLHGVPASGWVYRKMIDSLVASGFRVIIPDLLGFGTSAIPKSDSLYSPGKHAMRLRALMDALEVLSWTHVCHDYGSLVTWELFRQSPERINGLVLLNSIIYKEGFRPPVPLKNGLKRKMAMAMYRSRLTNRMMLKQLFKMGVTEKKVSAETLWGYQAPLLRKRTKGMANFFANEYNELPDYSSVVSSVDVPVLVIWGKTDEMLVWIDQSERVVEEMSIPISNVQLVDFKHFIQEENPAVLCWEISRWLYQD